MPQETHPGPTPSAPELSERQRRHLRGLAHPLKPVILMGKTGLTESVAAETARALHDHELIKVKAPAGDRDARDAMLATLAQKTGSALVQRIGNVAVLYRPRPKMPRILIPDT
jgi:RNA-binding protein